MRPNKGRLTLLMSVSVLVLSVVLWLQRQAIFDWIRLQGYQPSSAVVQLAGNTTMNASTRHLFYVYHPDLENRNTFSQHCPNDSEKTIILGCYINSKGIYLFSITDPRLDGVEEVTAAHETLHAEYDRLNPKEKERVDKLINQAYAGVTDPRIRSTIDSYQKAGADTTNELHSILGTEVRHLPPDLEAYYARYFSDRQKIVSYSEQYEKAFSDRKAEADSYLQQINALESKLATMRSQITGTETSLRAQYQALETERTTTNDPAAFNTKVNGYNAQVLAYQSLVNTYNSLVKQHNDLVNAYNAVALEENELLKAIDSHTSTIRSQ